MSSNRSRILFLARLFSEETDEEHGLTLSDVNGQLEAAGMKPVTRKTLYEDVEQLRESGLDIQADHRSRSYYYFQGDREFELPELKLLVDSVQASRFITERKSRQLIKKLESLASRHQARALHRQVLISGRVKSMNESIYYNVDKLHAAINQDSQIQFQYFQWDVHKRMVPADEGHFEALVSVAVSPQFFGWLFSLGEGIRLTGPQPVVNQLRATLGKLSGIYE